MTRLLKTTPAIGVAIAALLGAASAAFADPPAPATIADFTLSDQSGAAHQLYKSENAPLVVIATHANGDPVSREAVATLQKLKTVFGKAEYFLLNSSSIDTATTIAAEAASLNTTLPILDDDKQLVARALGVTQTGEAYVIDPIGWKILYHGPVSEAAAADATEPFLLFNAVVYGMGHRPMERSDVAVRGTPITIGEQ